MKKKYVGWNEIYNRVNQLDLTLKYYGIPRGGAIVAGLTGNAVDSIDKCDIIIDDIYDSGKTASGYTKYNKELMFLYDKRKEPDLPWIEFPWENTFDRGFENDIVRVLERIGENPNREGLKDTPKRVVKAWKELTYSDEVNLTTFDANGYDEMIISKDITYYTFCEHHMLPFFGVAHIGYIPSDKIVGLSKLARIVDYYSKRLNTQEYLTNNIADILNKTLKPKGVGVVVEGRHLCQEMRGIKKRGKMLTSSLKGLFLKKPKVKQEFLNLIKETK